MTRSASFTVKTGEIEMPNRQFWRAIGYDFMFKLTHEPSGQALLDRGKKHGTIKYIRSHFTFNNQDPAGDAKVGGNICGQVMTIHKDGTASYDFGKVNATFQEYVKRGMKPVVEFDFFPDGMCYDSEEEANDESFSVKTGLIKNWDLWTELLNKFMANLEETFGKEELKTWYFEVWNEPDAFRDEKKAQLYRLYDVFAHVVKSFDKDYKIGGPATYNLYALKDFMDHITAGTNYVTGEIGSPIDFISHHTYGLSGGWLNRSPEIVPQVSKFSADMLWWQRLVKRYHHLGPVEMHLNEWGVCSHGDTKFVAEFPQLEYRNSEFSGLFLVKLVDCLKALERDHDLRTEMLLYWGACWNAGIPKMFLGSRDLTTTGNVPKPILTAWELLCRLGESFLCVDGPLTGGRHGLLAAKSDEGIQLLAYNFNETDDDPDRADTITINVDGLADGDYDVAETRLDQKHHNTYRTWQKLGSPENPEAAVIDQLIQVAEPTPDSSETVRVENGVIMLERSIPRHGMLLLELTAK